MRSSAARAFLTIAGAMSGVPLAAQVPQPVAATAGLPSSGTSFVPGSRTVFDCLTTETMNDSAGKVIP